MNLRLNETRIIKHRLQFFWRVGRHPLDNAGPLGIAVYNLHHDGELTARLQYTVYLLKTMLDDAGFIQTEIHRMKPSNATIIGMKS